MGARKHGGGLRLFVFEEPDTKFARVGATHHEAILKFRMQRVVGQHGDVFQLLACVFLGLVNQRDLLSGVPAKLVRADDAKQCREPDLARLEDNDSLEPAPIDHVQDLPLLWPWPKGDHFPATFPNRIQVGGAKDRIPEFFDL